MPKDMMLTALARPRFDHEGKCVFDGKICCERVCEPTGPRAKKAFKDVSMNNMVTTLGFPVIVEKFKHMRVREVTMQQDGARCHTQKKNDGFEAMTQK